MDERLEIKCGNCDHVGIIMGDCATECEQCGASVDPETGKPYTLSDGTVVKCYQFGGRGIV
jgi:ribosomal protein S27E